MFLHIPISSRQCNTPESLPRLALNWTQETRPDHALAAPAARRAPKWGIRKGVTRR